MSNGIFQTPSLETVGKTQFFREVPCWATSLTAYRKENTDKTGSRRSDTMSGEKPGSRYRGRRNSDLPPDQLKLGKGASFVKTHIKRLPLVEDVWEADFQPYPEPEQGKRRRTVSWIGTVVSQTSYFILADDLGYADLGSYGARADVTPCLDRMAAEGMRFTDGYSNSPVCSPTG